MQAIRLFRIFAKKKYKLNKIIVMGKKVIFNELKKETSKGRCISSRHIDAYKTGIFKRLFDGIKEDPELSLEMRIKDQAMVYYRKDKILTTSFDSKGNPKVKMLDKKYYNGQKGPSVNIEEIYNLRSLSLIRKYFKEAKRLVYFYKMGEEFAFQQNIAMGNQSFNNQFLVVDMEWQFSQDEINAKERISRTRIDLVIVNTEKNEKGYNDIYLAELKVGTGATGGKSGIIDHVNKTKKIIDERKACNSLIQDVQSIIRNKTDLGLITGVPKDFVFGEKPKMMLISAYRGNDEKAEMEKEAQKARSQARKIGMEEPLCIFKNVLIPLCV